jgi:hypothetical protein
MFLDEIKDKFKLRYIEDTGVNYGADWTHPDYIAYLEEELDKAEEHIENLEFLLNILREENMEYTELLMKRAQKEEKKNTKGII